MSLFRILARQERTALLAWGIALFLYLLMIGASYITVKDNEEFDKLWEEYPEGLREAFGGLDSITSVKGYYVSQAGSYLPLLFGIYLVLAGTKRLVGAQETGLLDHLLARPTPRRAYVGTLGAALGVIAVLILLAATLGAVAGFAMSGVSAADLGRVVAASIDMVPAIVFWWGLGLLLGSVFHQRSGAAGLGIGLVLGLYALQIVAGIAETLSWVRYLTPFGYHSNSDLYSGEPSLLYWVMLPLLGAGMALYALRHFERKDLLA